MDEIGVVCSICEGFSPLGSPRCVLCGVSLQAPPPAAAQPSPPVLVDAAVDVVEVFAPRNVHRDTRRGSGSSFPGASIEPTGRSEAPAPIVDPHAPIPLARRSLPSAMPLSDRRGARPQAPDVLANAGVDPPPRVEVVRSAAQLRITAPRHQTSSKMHSPAVGWSKEELMEQARSFVCRSCQTPVPSGHKYCVRCGAPVPPDVLSLREEFYGTLQEPGRAKLIVIRSEGDAQMEGLSFALTLQEHVLGRQGHLPFPDDHFISPRHGTLYYRDGVLVVRDDGSLNGIFVRIRGTLEVQPGESFLVGEQLFRIDATPKATDHTEQDGTYFWSSPKRPSPFRVTQILQGGSPGITVCAKEAGIAIGREGGDINFPTDIYMSATHCRLDSDQGGRITLTDLNSRNGTYVRLRNERELFHGDYLFVGKKILRVEVST